jgi:glycosyltransferase involved in cell wall biosynthesis
VAEAVATLTASDVLRREVAGAARKRVLERFAIDRVGAQYLSLYQELLG